MADALLAAQRAGRRGDVQALLEQLRNPFQNCPKAQLESPSSAVCCGLRSQTVGHHRHCRSCAPRRSDLQSVVTARLISVSKQACKHYVPLKSSLQACSLVWCSCVHSQHACTPAAPLVVAPMVHLGASESHAPSMKARWSHPLISPLHVCPMQSQVAYCRPWMPSMI